MTGDELTPWLIRYAYEQGVFPMTEEDGEVGWYQPYNRALLPIEGLHVSHSLSRRLRRGGFDVRFDTSFDQVMRGCLRPTENWISEAFIRTYTQIHLDGWGHCCEVWIGGDLVGGVYGIALGSCFCAESMFHRATDCSKIALWALVERCRELGFTMFDAQIMTPHLRSLGAFEVTDAEFQRRLAAALKRSTPWSRPVGA